MNQRRILFIADRLSERGGADHYLLSIARELVARGHTLHILVGRDDGTADAPCDVVELPGLDARDAALPATGLPWSQCLGPLLRDFSGDTVHLHNVVNPLVLETLAERRCVLTIQDHRFFCPGRGKLKADRTRCQQVMTRTVCGPCFDDPAYAAHLFELTARRLAAAARIGCVTVLSHYMQGELCAAGLKRERVHVVPPFVHGLDLDAKPEQPCVLFVGRLVSAKGPLDAARAWQLSGTPLPLVFAGTGSQRPVLEKAGHRVLGWLDRARLSRWYRGARALLFPSRWQEPFGIAGLEALAFGTPVAAWRSGGIEQWHSGDATLANWGDTPALANALTHALSRPMGRQHSGVLARQVNHCINRLLNTYNLI